MYAFPDSPKTREERADFVETSGLKPFKGEMREFLLGVLEAYSIHGESELALDKLSAFLTAKYGTIADAKEKLGDVAAIRQAFIGIQQELYRS